MYIKRSIKEYVAHLILKVPDAVFVSELLVGGACLGQNAALEPAHVEEEVWVVFGVDRDEGVLPLNGGYGARETVLYVPEHSPVQHTSRGREESFVN